MFSDRIPSPRPFPRLGGERESVAVSSFAQVQCARNETLADTKKIVETFLRFNAF
jgi:hypothetical protein